MKTKSVLLPSILWTLLLILGIQTSKAQNIPAEAGQNESVRLIGSNIKTKDIISKMDAIFVGKITKRGEKVILPPIAQDRGNLYGGIKVAVAQVLRGSVDTQISVTLFLNALYYEKLPWIGTSYIFFVTKDAKVDPFNPDPFTVLKLLPATDANIAKVKKLIVATPPSK